MMQGTLESGKRTIVLLCSIVRPYRRIIAPNWAVRSIALITKVQYRTVQQNYISFNFFSQ